MKTRICIPITERTLETCSNAIEGVPADTDFIELRLDYLKDLDQNNPADQIEALIKLRKTDFILTFRPREQGGVRELDISSRIDFWKKLQSIIEKRSEIICDIEWDIANNLELDWLKSNRRITSYHNFNDSPDTEERIFSDLLKARSPIIKFAVRGKSITDCIRIRKNIERARNAGHKLISIVMDEPGLISRVLGPGWGSYLTFASIASDKGSAPGQITFDEITGSYGIRNISKKTIITGLIGNPVSQSVSPAMHNALFAANDIDAVYLPMLVSDLEDFIKRMVRPSTREFDWNLLGLSVTIPHKINVMGLLDDLSETAVAVGAVNTLVIYGQRLIGHNTDVQGAIAPLKQRTPLQNAKIAIIGTGGAARAVAFGLANEKSDVTIFGRRLGAADEIAQTFGAQCKNWDELGRDDFDIVINTTPTGMIGHDTENIIPPEAVTRCRIYYDLVYNPLETELMSIAASSGVKVIGGLEMLVAQGAEQFRLWTGRTALTETMTDAAMAKLETVNKRKV